MAGGRDGERGFEDLDCYQLALQVFREAYDVAGRLPSVERYNLADQLRRAATSAILNVAEGYGRYHYLDKARFFYYARGSLSEALSGFIGCQALGYTSEEDLVRQRDLCSRATQALNGYIRYTRRQRKGHTEFGDQVLREAEITYAARLESESPHPEFTSPESTTPESASQESDT